MLIWIIVAVIPIALLGSVLGTSRSGPARKRDRGDETWWAAEVENKTRPECVPTPQEALDG
ncbi:MAG: hypothetical protein ABSA91_01805 [Acidimicrobiales bacterium]